MKTQNSILIATLAALAFALAPVTQADGPPSSPPPFVGPIIAIHSAGTTGGQDVLRRGETGSFVLNRVRGFDYGVPVNFKVSGTAIAGVDYIALISPTYVGQSGYAVLSVKTLPNLRGSFDRQAYSVVVTLEPGPAYIVGQPGSAEIWIAP